MHPQPHDGMADPPPDSRRRADQHPRRGRQQAHPPGYPIDLAKPSKGFGDNTLWIITERNRSITTLLLPGRYYAECITTSRITDVEGRFWAAQLCVAKMTDRDACFQAVKE